MPRITKQMQLDESALAQPGPDNYRCQHCLLYRQSHDPFKEPRMGMGNTFVVSSSPIDGDDALAHDIRKRIGLHDLGASYALPVKCYPYHRKITAEQLRMCHPFVLREVMYWNPTHVLAMGATAVAQLIGAASIKSVIGSALRLGESSLTVTYDVSAALAGKPEFLASIARHVHRMTHGLTRALPEFPGWRRAK